LAENEYFKAIKHTEHLTRETRDAVRGQTPILQRQAGLLAQQAASGRRIARSNNIIAAASVAQVIQQQRMIGQQRQMMQQQAESLELQYREADEARKHRFAMWRQTPDGAAFAEWQQTAEAVAAILDSREYRWRASWDAAVARLRAEIPQEDLNLAYSQNRIALPPSAKQRTANVFRILSIVAAVIAGIALIPTLFNWFKVAAFGGAGIAEALGSTFTLVVSGGFAVFALIQYLKGRDNSHIVEAQRLEAERAAAQAQRSQARIHQFGFDPLYVQPGFAWYRWFTEDGFEGYSDAIRAYIQEAQTTFPAANTLPEIRLPDVVEPERATLPEQAAALTEFQTEQRQLLAS
jgi:hypothetical protein